MNIANHSGLFYNMLSIIHPGSIFLFRQLTLIMMEVESSAHLTDLRKSIKYKEKVAAYKKAADGLTGVKRGRQMITATAPVAEAAMAIVELVREHLTANDPNYARFAAENKE